MSCLSCGWMALLFGMVSLTALGQDHSDLKDALFQPRALLENPLLHAPKPFPKPPPKSTHQHRHLGVLEAQKRAFLSNAATTFDFGGIADSPLPFYTNAQGLVEGTTTELLSGEKETGQDGQLYYSVVEAHLYDDPALGQKDVTAARAFVPFFEHSRAGFLFSRGDPTHRGDHTLMGADLKLEDQDQKSAQTVAAHFWALYSVTSEAEPSMGSSTKDYAWGASLLYPGEALALSISFGRFGANFDPILEFADQSGVWQLDGKATYAIDLDGPIAHIEITSEVLSVSQLSGEQDSIRWTLPLLTLVTSSQDALFFRHNLYRTRSLEDYDYGRYLVGLEMSPSRVLAPAFHIEWGPYLKGTKTRLDAALDLMWSDQLTAELAYERSATHVQDAVIQNMLSAKLNCYFTQKLSWHGLVAYDLDAGHVGLLSRMRYEIAPEQEAYLVVNQDVELPEAGGIELTPNRLSLKAGLILHY